MLNPPDLSGEPSKLAKVQHIKKSIALMSNAISF